MEKTGEHAFHITKVHGENGERMHSTSQESMEKMGEDALHITKVHGEMGEDAFHITKAHGESGRRCIPQNKSPCGKCEKMHST